MSMIVRVIAPSGRDAELILALLTKNHIVAESCADVTTLLSHGYDIGPMVIAEESLTSELIESLAHFVATQPSWSDLPILILTRIGYETDRTFRLERGHFPIGAPVLLERPIRTATLLSNVQAALRARGRQYQVRDAIVARDNAVSELRAEQETLRRSEERFRSLVDQASVGIAIGTLSGGLSYMNPTLLRLLGYSREDMAMGTISWDKLTPTEYAQLDAQAVEELKTLGIARPYQKAYLARSGNAVPFLVGAVRIPAQDEKDSGEIAVFLTDLTSQKQAEAALIQSEKLAAVGRLAASISHEINNPLEAVTNLLYLARNEQTTAIGQEYMDQASQELARVSQIVGQTLRFHRQSTRPRFVTPRELIESVLALYQGRMLNAHVNAVTDYQGEPTFLCYEGDIRQVLNNLVGNAIDAMRGSGRLRIRCRAATNVSSGKAGVRITIADDGHGMSRSTSERIFEPFFTTKGIHGTGLGLWISHGIVEKHQGDLRVRSRNTLGASGTVFALFLPQEPNVAFNSEQR